MESAPKKDAGGSPREALRGNQAIPWATLDVAIRGSKIVVRYRSARGYPTTRKFANREEAHQYVQELMRRLRQEVAQGGSA